MDPTPVGAVGRDSSEARFIYVFYFVHNLLTVYITGQIPLDATPILFSKFFTFLSLFLIAFTARSLSLSLSLSCVGFGYGFLSYLLSFLCVCHLCQLYIFHL
ncbi:hypothetical protein BYT27DRAFT_6870610 [Phlegmacium glaucopus]|nr:hypothetical protein BYT27DRAFT_6870610 [Phlegmacium glaucopus]